VKRRLFFRPKVDPAKGRQCPRWRRDRSEAGDTLVEILISLTVISFAALAILLAFATSITGSGEHRNIVTFDNVMQTAAAEYNAAVQQQPTSVFGTCSAASTVNQNVQNGTQQLNLPSGYTATISGVQYWTPSGWSPSTIPQSPSLPCPSGASSTAQLSGLQLLTVTVSFNGRSSSTTAVSSNPIAPVNGQTCTSPSVLQWVSQPGNGLAGQGLFPAPTLVIEDSSGTPCRTDASQVKLAITTGSGAAGATLNNCVASLGYGETNFSNCSINTPNPPGNLYTLTATDTTDHLTSVASDPFSISAGVPVKLVFHQSPSNGTGGTPFPTQGTPPAQVVVYIEDAAGNVVASDNSAVTLAIGTNPGGGTLSGCSDSTVSGVASFTGCTIDKIGNGYTLTATDAADNLTTPSSPSNAFNITPGPAAKLAFTTSPGTTVVGNSLAPQPVVAVEDAGGNVTTTNMGAVSLGIGTNPGGGTLSGCAPTINGGTVTFASCAINKVGNGYTLAATDGSLTSATSSAFNVVKASPTIATALSASSLTVGGSAHDTATLSGFSAPTGTVAYSYYTNNTCTAGQVNVNTVTVAANGTVPNSSTVAFNTPGTYYWQAVYGGDANNNGASSLCTATNNEQLTVKYSPTIATALSASSITAGTNAYDTTTLSGVVNSSGMAGVTYSYYTNNTCTANAVTVNTVTVATNGTVPNSNTVTFNSVGTYYWQAVYSGDADNYGVSSTCTAVNNEKLTVTKASPTVTAGGPGTGIAGTAITAGNINSVFASSSGANATGTIT